MMILNLNCNLRKITYYLLLCISGTHPTYRLTFKKRARRGKQLSQKFLRTPQHSPKFSNPRSDGETVSC